jgi:hypothetical protein
MLILAHVTHEAVDKIGGIGAVLDGLCTTPEYLKTVGRTVLVGPLFTREGPAERRLGARGRVLYSSLDGIDAAGLGGRLRPIELAFGCGLIYGRRTLEDPITHGKLEAEVLLVDVHDMDPRRVNDFKARLFRKFDLHSARHESIWDFEQYTRIAEPAYHGLHALMNPEDRVVVLSHEYMGVPTALAAIASGDPRFATMYHCHETPIVRKLVEDHGAHDTGFYNVMAVAERAGLSLEQVYGNQDAFFKHPLMLQARHCDAVLAVGHLVEREFKFIDRRFEKNIRLAYNGVPARKATMADLDHSKALLKDYTQKLLGFRPDYVMTHVTRPVMSKAIWRDLMVLHHLDPLLAAEGKKAVMYILTTAGGVRSERDVRRMEAEYGWPAAHREGYPDLVGPEVGLSADCEKFNRTHSAIKCVFVNQFGWNRTACGERMPADMAFLDLRKGAEVEFGQSIYEPYGISQLEALCFGAVCVMTNVCGSAGHVEAATKGKPVDNVLIADYTAMDTRGWDLPRLKAIERAERDAVEQRVSAATARELHRRLPRTPAQMESLLEKGYALAAKMDWAAVYREYFGPALHSVLEKRKG